jgi:hypothetical protein
MVKHCEVFALNMAWKGFPPEEPCGGGSKGEGRQV